MSRLLPLAVSRQVVAAFRPHFKPGKVEKMEGILNRRQRGRALILENIHDPHNAAACFRSADAFGFQEVHIIDRYNRFDEHRASNVQAARTSGSRKVDTGGAGRWLTTTFHSSADTCLNHLQKERGYRLLVSDVHGANATDLQTAVQQSVLLPQQQQHLHMVGPSQAIEAHCSGGPSAADNAAGSGIIDTAGSDGKPSGRLVDEEEGEGDDKWAVLFGNENRGVSRFVRRHADQSFWLPTVGFVESINVSVACGASLFYLSTVAPGQRGLPQEFHQSTLALWLIRQYGSGARRLLDDHGIELDDF